MYIKYRYINGLSTYDAAYMYMYIYAASIYIWSMWVYEYMLGSWISWCFWLVNGRCVCSQTTNVLLDVNVICGSVPSKMMLSLLILLTVSISSRLCVSSHVWKRGGGFARDKSSVEPTLLRPPGSKTSLLGFLLGGSTRILTYSLSAGSGLKSTALCGIVEE